MFCPAVSCVSFVQLALVWMPTAESHLSLLDIIVRSAERLCKGELRF